MEPLQNPTPLQPVAPQPVTPIPQQSTQPTPTQRTSYFKRLFQGRLNIRNGFIGSFVPIIIFAILMQLVIVPAILAFTLTITPNQVSQVVPSSNFNIFLTTVIGILYAAIFIVFFIGMLSVEVRRLHDLNKSGWLFLLFYIPFLNIVWILYVTFWPGTKGENNYGPQPQAKISLKEILKLN